MHQFRVRQRMCDGQKGKETSVNDVRDDVEDGIVELLTSRRDWDAAEPSRRCCGEEEKKLDEWERFCLKYNPP